LKSLKGQGVPGLVPDVNAAQFIEKGITNELRNGRYYWAASAPEGLCATTAKPPWPGRNLSGERPQQMTVGREHELVLRALAGNPAAFAALVAPARPRMLAVTTRIVGADDAEDILQEALIRAFLGLSRLRDPERVEAWLTAVAVNVAKMWLRSKASQARAVAAAGPMRPVPAERELLDIVRQALEVLPDGQRDVVLLHYIDDLSCGEIAHLVGTTPAAVRVRLHRARAQLRRELAPLAPAPFGAQRKELPMVAVKVEDVVVRVAADDPSRILMETPTIILLKEKDGERSMPIFVGLPEGVSLAAPLADDTFPRPTTADLTIELLRATGGSIERIAITSIRENTFYALISVNGAEVDSRPSDAINLAVRTAAPILLEERLLEEYGLGGLTLEEKLEQEAARKGLEIPLGDWKSLSMELLFAQNVMRWTTPP
jgi:RNA polymerase sigma factor (sigma-70 family)